MINNKLVDLTSKLIELEKKYPVHEWVMSDIHVWPLFRYTIVRSNRGIKKQSVTTKNKTLIKGILKKINSLKKIYNRLFNAFKIRIVDQQNNERITKNCVLLFTAPSNRRLLVKEKYFDVFMDPIALKLNKEGERIISIEEDDGSGFRYPRYRSSWIADIRLIFLEILASFKLQPNRDFLANYNNLPFFDEIINELSNEGYDTSKISQPKLYRYVNKILKGSRVYGKLFDHLRPKEVYVIGTTNKRSLSIILAAHRKNIQVTDVQHGVHGPPMRWAYHWTKFPKNGYEVLPNKFWCWTNSDVNEIEGWPCCSEKDHTAFKGGNLIMELILEGKLVPDSKATEEFKNVYNSISSDLDLLITLQPDYIDKDFFKKLITEAPSTWTWWIRLHPRMELNYNKFNEIFSIPDRRIFIKQPSESDLYTVLNHIDIHLTHSSSVTIEAAQLNTSTILWSDLGKVTFNENSICHDRVIFKKNISEIIEYCEKLI